jgi:hypothetical protein
VSIGNIIAIAVLGASFLLSYNAQNTRIALSEQRLEVAENSIARLRDKEAVDINTIRLEIQRGFRDLKNDIERLDDKVEAKHNGD